MGCRRGLRWERFAVDLIPRRRAGGHGLHRRRGSAKRRENRASLAMTPSGSFPTPPCESHPFRVAVLREEALAAAAGKEYFNCRSTRESRAHIRRSTDLSRTAEGLPAFSETKNKSASRGCRWFGNSGGCTGWVDPRMKGCQKPNERCDCTCS